MLKSFSYKKETLVIYLGTRRDPNTNESFLIQKLRHLMHAGGYINPCTKESDKYVDDLPTSRQRKPR